MKSIDVNCDLGEGFSNDEQLMQYISSANIACGFHAGDESTMKKTIELCIENNVAIGAHPGYDDRKNFGRTDQHLSFDEYYELIVKQLYDFKKIAESSAVNIHHIKPHGALYNQAAKNKSIAEAIAKAVKDFDDNLVLYGLSGSYLISEAEAISLKTASEVFADRAYTNDGSLVPRSQINALISNDEACLHQVLKMIKHNIVTSINNVDVPINADTICIHGDGINAVSFAKNIYQCLKENNIEVKAI